MDPLGLPRDEEVCEELWVRQQRLHARIDVLPVGKGVPELTGLALLHGAVEPATMGPDRERDVGAHLLERGPALEERVEITTAVGGLWVGVEREAFRSGSRVR